MALDGVPTVLAFERTVGDEIQGVVPDGRAAVEVVTRLVRCGAWRIGLGVGAVTHPLPESTRAARGAAFIVAREAVEAARRSPVHVALRLDGAAPRIVGPGGYGAEQSPDGEEAGVGLDLAEAAEGSLWLLIGLLRRRTDEGWTVVDDMDRGLSGQAIAQRLGVTPSAVSQRLRRAGYVEGRRGAALCAGLIDGCLRP